MSQVDSNVDLDALARPAGTIDPPRRSWLRIGIPIAVVVAFAAVLGDSLVELFQRRVEVTVLRARRIESVVDVAGAEPTAREGEVAVQAAGWIEPDPFPTLVPALAGGVLIEVLVQESDIVKVGDPIARTIADDARLAVDEAVAEVKVREAAVKLAEVQAGIAAERFEAGLEVEEAVKIAAARRQGNHAAAALRAAAVAEGRARIQLAESEVVVQRELEAADAAGPRQVEIAESDLEVARALLAKLEAEAARADALATESNAHDERVRRDLELRFDDRLARDETAAVVLSAKAALAQANAALATAQLALERTTVTAQANGVVLERIATAGDTLASGAPVCSLFDPASLRVRVDVAQNDIVHIGVGQQAEIVADARPGKPYRGEVMRLVQRADIQKVTLEAQVRVLDPDARIRPDMLAQVRFFAQQTPAGDRTTSEARRGVLAIPARIVREDSVWVFDPTSRSARRVELELGARHRLASTSGSEEEWVEVRKGLDLTDKLIDQGRSKLDSAKGADRPDGVPVRLRVTDRFADAAPSGGAQ